MKKSITLITAICCSILSFAQSWEPTAFLTAPDADHQDFYGFSVSITDNFTLIGAKNDSDDGEDSGSAYVYQKIGENWVFMQKLTASDAQEGDRFGENVYINDNHIFIHAYRENGDHGTVYHFELTDETWVQNQMISGSLGNFGDSFGHAIASFGNQLIIGSFTADFTFNNQGLAYIFQLIDGEWIEQQVLSADDPSSGDWYGKSVSMFGNKAIVTSDQDRFEDEFDIVGSVYFYVLNDGIWEFQQHTFASNYGPGQRHFGTSSSMFENTVLIGSGSSPSGPFLSGGAYIFEFEDDEWVEKQILFPSEESEEMDYDYFGNSVSVYENKAVIGCFSTDNDNPQPGRAFIFELEEDLWIEKQMLQPSGLENSSYFGASVSMWEEQLVIGAFRDDVTHINQGSAFIYNYVPPIGIIEINSNNLIHVYPNPSDGQITISAKDQVVDLMITSIDGKVVYDAKNVSNTSSIIVDNLESGIYVVHVVESGDSSDVKPQFLRVVVY